MAGFCKGCSIRAFGEDFGDLERKEKGQYMSLCEGCGGYIVHDETGQRLPDTPIYDPNTGYAIFNTQQGEPT